MKKVIFMIALLVTATFAYAQQPSGKSKSSKGQSLSPEEKAEKITSKLKTELSLTDAQVPKVKQATLTRIKQVATAKTNAGEDKQAFRQEGRKIFQNWEAEMKGILTPEQYTAYQAKKEEQKKKMQEKRGRGKDGQKSGTTDDAPEETGE